VTVQNVTAPVGPGELPVAHVMVVTPPTVLL
jgi:hypothetical protein